MLENSLGFQADFGLLSDDKALRYTSKAASLLGKYSAVSAACVSLPCNPLYRTSYSPNEDLRFGVGVPRSCCVRSVAGAPAVCITC
jgi:hypothetical protein